MSEHISRKDLKRDEVAETLVHGAEAVRSHQRMLWMVGGAALVVILAVLGWRFYTERQTMKASAALEEVMEVYHARIRQPGQPEEPGEITFVDEKNKYDDAAKKFVDVAQKYPRTQPGQVAQYYAGLSYEKVGRNDDAQQWLRKAESGSGEVAALSRFQLAGSLARTGKADEATKLYQQLMQNPTTMVTKPMVMLALASQYAKTNPAEAVKLYEQVRKDYADSPAAQEAEKHLELLPKS